MTLPSTQHAAVQPWLDRFGRLRPALPGARLPWLEERRVEALERFARQGFPGPRVEAWKYTNLKDLVRLAFLPEAHKAQVNVDLLPRLLAPGEATHRLVFVDGGFRADLSSPGGLPDGVRLGSLADALANTPDLLEPYLAQLFPNDTNALVALNTAFFADGLFLYVPRGKALEHPVEAVFLGRGADEPTAHHPRLLVVIESGAEATLVEHHVGLGSGTYFSNVAAELVVEPGARLHHYKLQAEAPGAFHIATARAELGRDASYDNFVLTQGARLSRNELLPRLGGPGGESRLSGAYMLVGQQHADHTSVTDHASPHCTSRQVYHGIIDDSARAVFQGKIIVRPDSQKTDGYQLNRALLLSDKAEIDSKPELEIYADDVKCSHGATAGELDDEQIFYLRARGIEREAARNLLLAGFLVEAVEEIRVEAVRDAFIERVGAWLDARRAA